ncbi:Aspartic proteinase nepenthesin-1 [Acorus gramineus]|uniref:Aspartic proteinase nepenthesin-1 n=1 Tax=Acorus gramineus TaxID=55184 RepID=A0AAV9BS02_ACOGR|nr:Aspartic proteinase nepenthesin-1 [Acorus gramineus]
MLDMLEPLIEHRDGYLFPLKLGTPPQVFQVYMDTGSDLTWVPCWNLTFDCMNCDDYRIYKLMASFSPSLSSSSHRDLCGSPLCSNVHSSDNPYDTCAEAGCSLSILLKGTCPRPCPSFSYTYGGGGVVTGILTRDTLRFHGGDTGVLRDVTNFCFGCVGTTYREPIGIVGFGRGSLSLPSQLGFLNKGFSHCFLGFQFANNPNMTSPLVMGDLAISCKDHFKYTPMLRSPMFPNYYYIGLEAIVVGNNVSIEVPSNLKAFDSQGNGGLLIDSGTTYTQLPRPLHIRLLSGIQSKMAYQRSSKFEKRTGFELCYKVPCSKNSCIGDFPSITLHFVKDVKLVLPKENCFYAMAAPVNNHVVKCLLFQSMEDETYGPAGVLGNFQQQNVEVVYDLEKERIGFHPMDCASSAASHGLLEK